MILRLLTADDRKAVDRVLAPRRASSRAVAARVARIVADVRRRGDRAVVAHARALDGLAASIEVTRDEIEAGWRATPAPVRRALGEAARHIARVARAQRPRRRRIVVTPGVQVDLEVYPLAKVGCYVPGGRYPLPSSLLMTAVTARVAGVGEIVAVCPRPDPLVLAAARLARVDRLFRIGGAHAVAALAYGTGTIPRVDKIVGPGSAYVTEAKALVSRDCAIDFDAGPSEIAFVTGEGRPAWIAADLVAQAEHDADARAILITWKPALARAVAAEVERLAPRQGPARTALRRNGAAIVVPGRDQAMALADRLAPEHLVCDDNEMAAGVRHGAAFVGPWTAQAAGDYATGSNHVLPTGGAARHRGGLSAADFVRVASRQRLTRRGLERLAATVTMLAEAEGLAGHAHSIRTRLR